MTSNIREAFFFNGGLIAVEIARYREVLDWGLTASASALLVMYNAVKLWRILRYPQGESSKANGGKRGKEKKS